MNTPTDFYQMLQCTTVLPHNLVKEHVRHQYWQFNELSEVYTESYELCKSYNIEEGNCKCVVAVTAKLQ